MRGTTLVKLSQLKTWWEGPAFLTNSPKDWPQLKIAAKPGNITRELKRKCITVSEQNSTHVSSVATLMNVGVVSERPWRLSSNHFSSWKRLTRSWHGY